MLYKGLKGAASVPTNNLVPSIKCTRNHHFLAFQTPQTGIDAKDSVTKFTSFVRARD